MQFHDKYVPLTVSDGQGRLFPVVVVKDQTGEHLLGGVAFVGVLSAEHHRQMTGVEGQRIKPPISVADVQLTEMGGLLLGKNFWTLNFEH